MSNQKRIEQFVGMLGSEHSGERANAASFLYKMAEAEKKTMVEFFRSAFGGGGSVRVEYRDRIVEKTVYRDRPINPDDPYRERAYEEENAPPKKDTNLHAAAKKAYGYGSLTGKIRVVLTTHMNKLTQYEREFMESLPEKLDRGLDLTPRQRKVLSEIFNKVGM